MKQILIIFLILITSSIWAANNELGNKKAKKITKQLKSDEVDLIVIGEVTDLEVTPYKRKLDEELSEKNVLAVTIVSFRVIKAYKGREVSQTIKVRMLGGRFYLEDKEYIQLPSNAPHPLLGVGDIILMGLKKDGEYYRHVAGGELQIPFTDELIDDIENQVENHKIEKLRKIQERNLDTKHYLSEDEIRDISDKNREDKKALIHKLKIELENQFLESEVIND